MGGISKAGLSGVFFSGPGFASVGHGFGSGGGSLVRPGAGICLAGGFLVSSLFITAMNSSTMTIVSNVSIYFTDGGWS